MAALLDPATDLVTGWLLFATLALALGAVVTRWVILPRDADLLPGADARRWLAVVGRRCSVVLLLALALVFGRQILEFHDPFAPWSEDLHLLLLGTSWGTTWMAAVLTAVLAGVAFGFAARGRPGGWVVASLAVVALGAFPALTGHAAAGDHKALTLLADTAHVWAMGCWAGGLALVLLLERRHRTRPTGEPGAGEAGAPSSVLPVLVPRFSPVAMAGVATLVVTGVFAAWIHLGSHSGAWGALVGTPYGRRLSLKVGLVLGVLGLGARNWRTHTPGMSGPAGPGTLRRTALVEVGLMAVVLAVTALLVRTPPG